MDFFAEITQVATIVVPITGTLIVLHRMRNQRLDKLEGTVNKLDGDFDGLVRQIGDVVRDADRRYVPKDDHRVAVNELREAITGLDRTIGTLNSQLFELARGHR